MGLLVHNPVTGSLTHYWKSIWNGIYMTKKDTNRLKVIIQTPVIWLSQLLLLYNINHPKHSDVKHSPLCWEIQKGYGRHSLSLLLDVWGKAGMTQMWAAGIWRLTCYHAQHKVWEDNIRFGKTKTGLIEFLCKTSLCFLASLWYGSFSIVGILTWRLRAPSTNANSYQGSEFCGLSWPMLEDTASLPPYSIAQWSHKCAHIQKEGTQNCPLNGISVKRFANMFWNVHT